MGICFTCRYEWLKLVCTRVTILTTVLSEGEADLRSNGVGIEALQLSGQTGRQTAVLADSLFTACWPLFWAVPCNLTSTRNRCCHYPILKMEKGRNEQTKPSACPGAETGSWLRPSDSKAPFLYPQDCLPALGHILRMTNHLSHAVSRADD